MGYTHTFKLHADELTKLDEFEESLFTLKFEFNGEGEIEDYGVTHVDGEDISLMQLIALQDEYGAKLFWEDVESACEDEQKELLAGWADDAAEYRAEQAMEPDERIADMGMDVPAR